jgi:hypothetical protein
VTVYATVPVAILNGDGVNDFSARIVVRAEGGDPAEITHPLLIGRAPGQ